MYDREKLASVVMQRARNPVRLYFKSLVYLPQRAVLARPLCVRGATSHYLFAREDLGRIYMLVSILG